MAARHSKRAKRVPKVRIGRPAGRPIQLRYTDPATGREVRISTGTLDGAEALDQKSKLEAKLTLGIDVRPRRRIANAGAHMTWAEFRDAYTRLKVSTFRSEGAKEAAEVRLDICEKIVSPRILADMAKPATLATLQAELLAGTGSPRKMPRSAHTVRSYVKTLLAALSWAGPGKGCMKWLAEPVDFTALEADDPDKGRPLVLEEFERMLAAIPKVILDDSDRPSWRYFLRGLWESGLRLSEALSLAWDIDGEITPVWPARGLPVLHIPAKRQKSRKAQDVPTTPGFADLLAETPKGKRKGWVFNPGARRGQQRLTQEQTGRIVTAIGKAALVVVNAAGKPASAHDLRRSFGQRMADAGLPVRDLQAIMRHASITTTEAYYLRDRVQDQAARIAKYLGTAAAATKQTATSAVDANPCQ
jgi:integrase